jgi:hypothetical protein
VFQVFIAATRLPWTPGRAQPHRLLAETSDRLVKRSPIDTLVYRHSQAPTDGRKSRFEDGPPDPQAGRRAG